jgi:hypothetical protein
MILPDRMEPLAPAPLPSRLEGRLALGVFLLCLLFNFWGMRVGWTSKNLPGGEFRQAQTALSTYWIKAENNFSLAYPTPVLGKPWSIPMEFPLYQWTVVITGKLTNWGLTKAGRAVSIGCFYLCLPAIFLLLDRWRVAIGRRWLVLAVVLTCPFYIFYGRAFLIETMALMFSLWFWVAFERAVAGRSAGWLALAIVAGTGAGLVKVTTFILYLLPAGCWALARLWTRRKDGWRIDLAWMAGAVALPFAATLWWLRFADDTKSLSPAGSFLVSANLRSFNLGTTADRFSLMMWALKARIVSEELSWLPVIGLCGILAVLAGRPRWREITACVACFGAAFVFFPMLYAYHDYYYVANTVLLLMAMGLALVALAESRVSRGIVGLVIALVLVGQVWRYAERYFPSQSSLSPGGDGLTDSLRVMTNPRDVVVVLGQDWNSMLPYYAQRRALMVRDDLARNAGKMERALAGLDGETIGALVIVGRPDGRQWLIDRASVRGLAREPLYVWRDAQVYLPQARRAELLSVLLDNNFHEVRLASGVVIPQDNVKGKWCELAVLPPWQRMPFHAMQPEPVRFFSRFGPALDESGGLTRFGAHPVTRLVFSLPAGPHRLFSTLQMSVDAYRLDLPDSEATDGVEVTLFALGPNDERRQLATRYFDPRHRPEDRGNQRPFEFEFTLPAAGEVELYFGPGPADRDTRDWIILGPLRIE